MDFGQHFYLKYFLKIAFVGGNDQHSKEVLAAKLGMNGLKDLLMETTIDLLRLDSKVR